MSKFSVKKPFTVLVAVIAAITLGFVSLSKLQLDLLPEISLPYLIVITTYPGASAEKVEEEVCKPMEDALGTINGVENIYSICNENYGMVELEFQDGTDLDSAMVKVSSALNTLESYLPEDCGTPSIMEIGTNLMASIYLAVSMEGMSAEELSQFVEDNVTPAFERKDGVASVTELGLVDKTIQVELDKDKVDVLNDKILASTDDAFAEALEKLDDAKQQLVDSEEKLGKSKNDLAKNQKKIEDGKQDLVDGQKDLEDGKKELAENKSKLADSKEELEKGQKELEDKKKETYDKLAQASEALNQLNAYKARLTEQNAQLAALEQAAGMIDPTTLAAAIPALQGAVAAVNTDTDTTTLSADELSMIADQLSPLGITTDSLAGKSVAEAQDIIAAKITDIIESKSSYESEIDAMKVEIAVTEGIIKGYESQLGGTTEADIEKAKMEAAAGFGSADAQMTLGKATIESTEAQLESAEKSLEDAQKQIDDGWETINDSTEQIADGWKQIKDGQKQITDGWDDYNDAVKSYEKQKAEAIKKANADDLLQLDTLATLIYAQNFEMPAGYVDDKLDNSWLIKVGQNFEEVEELEDVVLCNIHKVGDVKLGDVANITVIDNADDSYVRLGAERGIILSVFKSSIAGTNDVSKVVHEAMDELMEQYPGLKVSVLMDQGDYIDLIVRSVLQSMAIGALLAVIILAIFLRDAKPTLVVAISIPLSVLSALILMYFSKISLNMLSLSGLALGIGMLVDNSIVVIENIYRLRGRGVEAPRAAVQGANQVAGAITSSTLTTACVFLPMIYTTGLVNELMAPMCLTIVYCLMASLFIAMTVVPAAASTILRNAKPKEHRFFDRVQDAYGTALGFCLKRKWVPISVAVALLVFTGWLIIRMGIVMIPDMTMNQIQADIAYPEDMDKMQCYETTDEVIERLLTVEGLGSIGVMAGDDTALMSSELAGTDQESFRKMSFLMLTENPNAGEEEIRRIMKDMETAVADLDVDFKIATASSEMDSMLGGTGLSINIYGDDLEQLNAISHDFMDMIGQIEGYTDISNGEEDADKVIHLVIDKNKAMAMGLSVAQIYQDISSKIKTSKSSVTVTIDGIEMDIKIVDEMAPLTKENLLDYTFTVDAYDEDDDQVTREHTLGEIAREEISDGVVSIDRKNQSRYITVTANVAEGYNTTLLTRKLEPILEKYKMPSGYVYELGGEYDSVVTMIKQMLLVAALGMLFIYLVMVAQFQSLLSPFIVLFTIPLAFTGGFLSLWITRENMSVISMMGFIVLMGTVVNNGIVFVDYTNQLRKSGLDRHNALIATGKTRMRPILMTALTTILAESNLMLGDDMGAQLGKGMALVIAGGLAYATLMTLFIIPVMYDMLFKKQPVDVDTGSENLDDIMDDAEEYIAMMAQKGIDIHTIDEEEELPEEIIEEDDEE
jgi:multidrug efflux pump subunit AcrB